MKVKNTGSLVLAAVVLLGIPGCTSRKDEMKEVKQEAGDFLENYLKEFERLRKEWTFAEWEAAVTGKKEAFEKAAKADLALKTLHSDHEKYERICRLLEKGEYLDPLTRRALQVARLAFKKNQVPRKILEKLSTVSAEIERIFNTFRAEMDGRKYTNNDLLQMLSKERDSAKRRKIWEALKQVGEAVSPGDPAAGAG